MLFSNSITIIVVTRDRLIRADYASARAAEPAVFVVRERPHLDDPVALVETAIGFDRRKPGRVFVLSGDVWTHTIALASGNTYGLSAEELLQMLNFEAEPISGISAFEATAASLPLGETAGQRHFWLTQVSSAVRDQLDEAVRKLGGRFAGIAHPGGVPYQFGLAPAVGIPGRVEFWPGAVVRTVCLEGNVTKAHVDDGAVAANWSAVATAWKQQSSATQVAVVIPEGSVPANADSDLGATSFSLLEDDDTLRRWLAAWHQAVRAKTIAVPMIVPAARRMTARQRNMVAGVMGLIVVGACYAHNFWVASEIAKVAAEKTRLEAPGKEVDAIKAQIKTLETELTKVEGEQKRLANDVQRTEEVFHSHRRRLAEMMRRLSDDATHDWVLQKISANGREITLSGVTMHPEHIAELTAEITTDFGALGWAVDPAKQSARNLKENGGPWTFEIQLRDLNVPKPIPTGTSPSAIPTPPSTIVRVPAP
ncbi:MAG: hypothetical protein K8U03_25690 [Planctomycetia bacterium]|nr:hypothetical protein [Planctomycetia bacterium]